MLKIKNLCSFDFYILFLSVIYRIIVNSKESIIEDAELEELDERIIRKIETYIDEKLKPILEKVKIKKDYYEMSFL